MADQEWTPERLRALDVAVAEARGWTLTSVPGWQRKDGVVLRADLPMWISPDGKKWLSPPPVASVGCKETLDLIKEKGIQLTPLVGDEWLAIGEPYEYENEEHNGMERKGPTPAIAVCLSYLAAKGRPFNG